MLIETDRLRLRPLVTDDIDEFLEMHARPEVVATLGPIDRQRSIERLEGNEREWRERGHGLMAVLERATGRFAGRSGLKYWSEFDETEVGWVLHPDYWGRGLATEAGRACLEWGFRSLDVPYFTAMIVSDNARSIAVAERLGMRPMRSDVLAELPVTVYSIERDSRSSAVPARS